MDGPEGVVVNSKLYSLTLNMNRRYFHIKEIISGLLWSRLRINAPDELIEKILDYPEDALNGKNVTVLL